MDKTPVKDIQNIVFEIMCDLDDFCKKNNINYLLSGGTCLGAVRHKGFIPWDDDGDLMMPRPDYEKFVELYSKLKNNKYGMISVKTDSNWSRPHTCIYDKNSKIFQRNVNDPQIGIYVDIFPLDGLPKTEIGRVIYYKRLKLLDILRNACRRTGFEENESFKLIKRILKVFLRNTQPHVFADKLDRFAMKYDYNTADKVAVSLGLHYWEKETIDKSAMDQSIDMLFEGREFPVPVGYHQYLTNIYGDYMKIPKQAEEDGYSHLNREKVEFH